MKALTCIALTLSLCACQASGKKEFVCYTDGKLTERHVEVEEAFVYNTQIVIKYTDRQKAYYSPIRGESCQVEEL